MKSPREPQRRDAVGPRLEIVGTVVHGAVKSLTVRGGAVLDVHRHAVAGKGDVLCRDSRGLFIQLRNGTARVTPPFRRRNQLYLGTEAVPIWVKEITSERELVGYKELADFHYRGEGGFGRRSVLVAVANSPELPTVLGFIEITTGFLMSRPRTKVLDAPYSDGTLSWDEWGAESMRSLTSAVARISRIVVYPELRGLGLGRILVARAHEFAATRFHANGLKPLFLEITADMMKFVPFAQRSGMRYIGETEGNLHRVARDLRYLLADPAKLLSPRLTDKARGIMSAQRGYATILKGSTESVDGLSHALENSNGSLPPDVYERFHGVLRLPKPTYLSGLNSHARRFLDGRIANLKIMPPDAFIPELVDPLHEAIRIENLSITYRTTVERTTRTTAIQEAFGIQPTDLSTRVVSGFSLSIKPRTITLLFGPSGSGKTTILEYLTRGKLGPNAVVSGDVELPLNASIAYFDDLPSDKPLIEVLAANRSIEAAVYALNIAGLSEAHLYLRRYSELSNGQRYRAVLAYLIDSTANVWVADEFLSTLDRLSAAVVAANVAKHARRRGITLVVGAPHFGHFIDALSPDQVVRLSSAWDYEVTSGKKFLTRWRRRD